MQRLEHLGEGEAAYTFTLQPAILEGFWSTPVGILLLTLLPCLPQQEFEHLHHVNAVALGAAVLRLRRHCTVWQLLVQGCFKIPAQEAARLTSKAIFDKVTHQ